MKVISIGSSSSGNSYIIKAGSVNLLLDVGLPANRILKALDECGVKPADVDAILVTHEHIDHVRSVRKLSKECPNARFYASAGTINSCKNFETVPNERITIVRRGETIQIADVTVRCYALSHDACEPLGFSIIIDGKQLTMVTDTGVVTEEIYSEMKQADALIFEANHEESILMYGDYPYSVKMRIKSDYGHLSNVCSGEILARLLSERMSSSTLCILLAHLSEKNNTPYQARMTIEDILKSNGFESGKHYAISVAAKEGLTYL